MDDRAMITSRHESDHASMLAHFGWPITEVSRTAELEGVTRYEIPDGDPVRRATEYGCILLAPALHDTT
jgi:hypothetical protein